MSDPIPVTTRIMTADSGSSRNVSPTLKSPDVIQVNACCTIERSSGWSETSCQTAAIETRKDSRMAPHATLPETCLVNRRPRLAFSRNPTSGRTGTRSSIRRSDRRFRVSPSQAHEAVGVERLAEPEQADHDRQPDGGLCGCHGHDEEDDDLAVGGAERPAKRDEAQVHRVEHDFDREQDRDQVAPDEHAGGSDRKQNRREHEVVVERHHQGCSDGPGEASRRASTTAPTIATRIKTEVTSNAKA